MLPGFPIRLGYLAIVFLMIASPIPPDVFMPLAGFLTSQGELNFWWVVLVGTLSFMASVLPWYFIGRFIDKWGIEKLPNRYRRWLFLSPEGLEQANQWFRRKGPIAIIISFFLPGIRNLIWIPAGVSRMSLPTALLCAGGGGFCYMLAMTYAGYVLGDQYYLVKKYFASAYHVVFLVLAIAIVGWGIRYYLKRRKRWTSKSSK